MDFKTPITVRYAETDMMGVVYHANYLLYFEDARADLLHQLGFEYTVIEELGYTCPIIGVNVRYHGALHYGEQAFVLTSLKSHRPAKTTYYHRVYRSDMDPEKDAPLVEAEVDICVVKRGSFRPTSLKKVLPELNDIYNKLMEDSATSESAS